MSYNLLNLIIVVSMNYAVYIDIKALSTQYNYTNCGQLGCKSFNNIL